MFIGIYAYITQSVQVISSCCPIHSNDTQLILCECVRGAAGSMFRQCVCRQRTGSSQCPGLWLQIIGSPVNWDYFMSRLVCQRLRTAQTVARVVGASRVPCLLVTPSEQRLTPQCLATLDCDTTILSGAQSLPLSIQLKPTFKCFQINSDPYLFCSELSSKFYQANIFYK